MHFLILSIKSFAAGIDHNTCRAWHPSCIFLLPGHLVFDTAFSLLVEASLGVSMDTIFEAFIFIFYEYEQEDVAWVRIRRHIISFSSNVILRVPYVSSIKKHVAWLPCWTCLCFLAKSSHGWMGILSSYYLYSTVCTRLNHVGSSLVYVRFIAIHNWVPPFSASF